MFSRMPGKEVLQIISVQVMLKAESNKIPNSVQMDERAKNQESPILRAQTNEDMGCCCAIVG